MPAAIIVIWQNFDGNACPRNLNAARARPKRAYDRFLVGTGQRNGHVAQVVAFQCHVSDRHDEDYQEQSFQVIHSRRSTFLRAVDQKSGRPVK